MILLSSPSMLEVSVLSSSLAIEESHFLLIYFYGDAEGTVPTLQLYIEAFLILDYCIDHFEILDTTPLILEAELFLYFMPEGGLAERFPPRLIDWQTHLQDILNTQRHLFALLEADPT